jgi:hypothetical protein
MDISKCGAKGWKLPSKSKALRADLGVNGFTPIILLQRSVQPVRFMPIIVKR